VLAELDAEFEAALEDDDLFAEAPSEASFDDVELSVDDLDASPSGAAETANQAELDAIGELAPIEAELDALAPKAADGDAAVAASEREPNVGVAEVTLDSNESDDASSDADSEVSDDDDSDDTGCVLSALPPLADDDEPQNEVTGPTDYDRFLEILVGEALSRGATRAAGLIPTLLEKRRFDASLAAEGLGERLLLAGIVEHRGDQLIIDTEFSTLAEAWRRVLSGESSDFSPCGTTTLDDWTVGWMAPLLGVSDKTPFRRALRKSGIAAFGLLAA
jgi:hypothetical protein